MGILRRLLELRTLYAYRRGNQKAEIHGLLKNMRDNQNRIESMLGKELQGMDILEIGPGQHLKQARFFGIKNRVVAIDLDEIEIRSLSDWLRLWKVNGTIRLVKNFGRKLLGIDKAFLREYYNALPSARDANIQFHRRDATRTGFADNAFDVTVSFSVLEHIPDAQLILKELSRVTRPNGVFYHVVHLYASDSGCHDPRTFKLPHPDFPYWCHLRPSTMPMSSGNCYVNKVSVQDWIKIAEMELPECSIERITAHHEEALVHALAEIRKAGELNDYSDIDLLTNCLIISWRKPSN